MTATDSTVPAAAPRQPYEGPAFSLVLSTLGRTDEIRRLLASLQRQTLQDFEVIVVDQNADTGRLAFLDHAQLGFSLRRVCTPDQRGLSRGRNVGARHARGERLLFPDDDCWYGPSLLADLAAAMARTGADIVSGRAADEAGRSINGRYESRAQWIDRRNIWTTQIEWVVVFRRVAFEEIGGYDESIGIGAASPWQACEGQDIVLRALRSGYRAWFDPALVGHHAELDIYRPDATMRRKGRGYARGLGRVLRLHGYSPVDALNWTFRPLVRTGIALLSLQPDRAAYYFGVAAGRAQGYFGGDASGDSAR